MKFKALAMLMVVLGACADDAMSYQPGPSDPACRAVFHQCAADKWAACPSCTYECTRPNGGRCELVDATCDQAALDQACAFDVRDTCAAELEECEAAL